MAVEVLKSKAITNRDAAVSKISDFTITRARLVEAVGVVTMISGASIGSKAIFATVPSNARISQILLSSDDIGATTIGDIGLYRTTEDGGAVVDADFFGSAVSLKDGALADSSVAQESGVFSAANAEKRIYEVLNLPSDPNLIYDVVITLTAAADAGGAVGLKVRYTE